MAHPPKIFPLLYSVPIFPVSEVIYSAALILLGKVPGASEMKSHLITIEFLSPFKVCSVLCN